MMVILPAQIRAGRALLDWSIADLSDASGVSVSSIQRIEKTPGECDHTDALGNVALALSKSGVRMVKDMSSYGVMLDTRGRQ
ncbi:MAG: helix-turn-helix transcriptional regulator [Pelagibacterium sp.]|uniref:helix-turn-helix transcriptional regulator n=1 Tax=Pelagibacterium sp. TaxID=1967288 RepID=UPI0032EDAFBB